MIGDFERRQPRTIALHNQIDHEEADTVVRSLPQGDGPVLVRLVNNLGGLLSASNRIRSAMGTYSRDVSTITTRAEGACLSAAAGVFIAGSHRVIACNALLAFHAPYLDGVAITPTLRIRLDAARRQTAAEMQAAGWKPNADLDALLKGKIVLTAREAVHIGLADAVGPKSVDIMPFVPRGGSLLRWHTLVKRQQAIHGGTYGAAVDRLDAVEPWHRQVVLGEANSR